MANRPFMPMTDSWRREFLRPRGPAGVPQPGEQAPDFTLPFARYAQARDGVPEVRYGQTITLSALRGRPVVLNFSRIVSDRFF
jgi:hypothetical protein